MVDRIGTLVQNGYVVRDLERAVEHWTRKVGVGPFFLMEHVKFEQLLFRGRPTDADISLAIAYWGEMQIELVVQHNDAPSIYSEFGAEGLQHVGVMIPDLDAELTRLRALDIEPVQSGSTANGFRFAYLNTDAHPGGMVELIETDPGIEKFFAKVRAASLDWDGREPLRRLGKSS